MRPRPRKPWLLALVVFPVVAAAGGILLGGLIGEAGLYLGTLALSGGLTGLVCTRRGVGALATITLSALSTVMAFAVWLLLGAALVLGICSADEASC